jgi:antitoxin component YwqK of YwqJK toxin-antitoxin module
MDALWNSQIERRHWSLRYWQEGRLRLLAETRHGNLHGEFLLFYPDEKLWMMGTYQDNRLVNASMKVFMPDGTRLKPTPPPNNVIPFPAERGKEMNRARP